MNDRRDNEAIVFRGLARAIAVALLPACTLAVGQVRDYRDRVGIYVWGRLAGGLENAAADVKSLGADRVVRVAIGPSRSWDPAGQADNSPLDR